ncbi:MFS transporter [Fimbriiglobus ruber]|uniref:Putative transmembrane efflux protein n=1 Tax=Fimbriiglobus ruber TaxID=1908690 RepID=A0A225D9S1_9BACT|nr:MFS transporter [Fimbriiglobus ruber]OWK38212.1 putative transmembrane efflux protein [Fimbriiglobus ruber]
MSTATAPAPATQSSERTQHLLAAVAVVPVLASVYQTLVLTDVTSDVIRKGIEGDSYQMIWTNVAWGVSVLYGLFGGIAWMARHGARSALTIGLVVFALGNLLCGAAADVDTLCGAKLVEGIGKGMVIVVGRSTLYKQFDRAVLVAIGVYGVLAYATRPTTPLFTAYVDDALSWWWVFWVNVPIALAGLVLVRAFFRPDRPPRPLPLRIDWLAVTLLAGWAVSLTFAFGWYRKWGGWSSNEFAAVAVAAAVLPVVLVVRVWGGANPDEHLTRVLKVRGYVIAMSTRMLLIVNLLAVLTLMAVYMVNLRDYPREAAGEILASASLPMAATTLLTTVFHRRALRPLMLLVGALGSSACVWWMSSVDNFTPKEDVSLMLAVWGGFVGLLPPVFLTDEVEVIDPRDGLYAGALGAVCLIVPLVLVPTAMQTAVSEWTDRAVDVQRLNLREERPAVRDAAAAVADDYRQRGATPGEAQELAGVALGAYVKLEATARGMSGGLRFLSLTTGVLGLVVGLLRLFAPSPPLRKITP